MANKVQLEAVLKLVSVQINPGVFNQISRAAAGMPGPVQQFNRNLTQSVSAAGNVQRSVRRVTDELTGSQRAARLFLQRMAQFAILLPTFATLNKSIQGGVKFLFEFDSAVKEIIKADVGSLSGKFDEIAKSAFSLSTAFGVSAIEAANTIKTYVQAGYELTKANELAELSLLGVRASTLDAGQSVEFLLSATKQFKLEGADLTRALDSLVNVEGVSAVEAKDVADAFSTAGNSFAQFAKNIDDSIGLISALREQTRKSGNEIGTFFKTLQARIFAAGESRSAIESLGVSVQNLDGSLRPTLDVLNDLKVAFGGLNEAEQANAAKSIAGVRQFESLIGVMNSLGRANELAALSSQSAGEARKKEEVDSQKLNRRLDDLVVAAQKLAYALGEAGATDTFKNVLKTVTALVDGLTHIVKLLDSIKVPVLPILAPLAIKAVGSVFGLGGGGGGGGGTAGGRPGAGNNSGPGAAGGSLAASTSQNIAAMQQLAAELSQLTQILKQLNGLQAQQVKTIEVNIAAQAADAATTRLLTAAHQQATTWYEKAVGIYKNSIGSIQNSGAKFALQYGLLTLGVTVVTASLNALAEKLGGGGSFLGALTQTTSTGIQMAGQFAILGPQAALVAGLFGALADSTSKLVDAFEDNKKAAKELAENDIRNSRLKSGSKVLTGQLQGLDFLQAFGKTVKGRTGKQFDSNKSFNESFKILSPATKSFIKDVNDLKEVLFGHGTIRDLAKLDSAAFENKEALATLRASYDENGKSSLKSSEQLNLFFHALGRVDEAVDAATGTIRNIIHTFQEMKDLQDLIGFAQSVNKLGHSLDEASKAPEDFAQGIDKLRIEAGNAKEDLADAQRAFEALRKSLGTQGATEAGFNPADAEKFLNQLNDLLNKTNNGAAISEFLAGRSVEERKFADEFIKIDEKRRNAIIKSAEAHQALEVEIYKRGLETVKAQQEAAVAAASAMAKFNSELIKLGTTNTDVNLGRKIGSLKSEDVSGVLAGNSDLPKAIQDVINDTFVDGVKKAENNLSKVAEETSTSLVPLQLEIKNLATEFDRLNGISDSTENTLAKEKIQREITAKALEIQTTKQDGYIKSLEGLRALTVETKKAQEEAAKAEAERLKKTLALNEATFGFSKAIHDVNKGFQEFVKQRVDDLLQKEASAYEELKGAQQGVLSATADVSNAYKDYISTILQVNGALAEAKIRANLFGRDIGMLNGSIVTFQDKMTSLNQSFTSVLDDANMKLDQRIQLERQLAESTLSFLQQAQDQITSAGLNVFGQSAQENQGLQKGIDGLAYVAQQLGGSFQNFLGMDSQQISALSQSLLNLPLDFRKNIMDALSFLPSSTNIGGFNIDQLKQAIGQVGAGVAPEQGLPAISDLTAQQVEQLKILGQLGNEEAKLSLSQVVAAQKQLDKAQEQLDVAKLIEDRAREGLDNVRFAVNDEMAVIEQANVERRELLSKVIDANNANTLHDIESQSQLFADQNSVFREVGDQIVQGVSQAINAKQALMEAQTSLNNFGTMQGFQNQAAGFIPNFAGGNLSPSEAAGILHAAVREKKAMPNGAQLAVANTKEAIIPMYRNFADGNAAGSSIAAGISNIRNLDQTAVAAIARSVSSTLSGLTGGGDNRESLDKIAQLLTDLNSSLGQVRDSSLAIKTNTAGLSTTTGSSTPGAAATTGQEVKITLSTNQNNNVQITGLENLRDQLRQAIRETTNKQVEQQLEALMVQLDPVFQALNERGIISSVGQSR